MVHVSIYQGSILVPVFEPQPHVASSQFFIEPPRVARPGLGHTTTTAWMSPMSPAAKTAGWPAFAEGPSLTSEGCALASRWILFNPALKKIVSKKKRPATRF